MTTDWPAGGRSLFRRLDHSYSELVELFLRDVRRRSGHRIDPGLVLRKRERVADVRLVEERHRQTVDSRRDAAVRRCAHRERVEQMAKLRPLLLQDRKSTRL